MVLTKSGVSKDIRDAAGRIWRWLWFRQRLYGLCLTAFVVFFLVMVADFFGFKSSGFLLLVGVTVLPCELMGRAYAWRKIIGKSFNGLTLVLLKNGDATPPVTVDASWGIATKIAWWLLWRQLLVAFATFFILFLLYKMTGVYNFVSFVFILINIPMSYFWVLKLMGQSFGGVTLGLLKPDQTA